MPVSDQLLCHDQVPPSTLGVDMSSLLDAGENADVTFKVRIAAFFARCWIMLTWFLFVVGPAMDCMHSPATQLSEAMQRREALFTEL